MRDAVVRADLPPSTHLIGRGDEFNGMYFVLTGALRVVTISAAGIEALFYQRQKANHLSWW